jgi:hypothetical protein
LRRTGVISFLLVALAAPAGALAQSGAGSPINIPGSTSPFSPGLPQSAPTVPTTSTPTATSTSTNTNSGLSGTGIVAIAIGALVVLGGISFFIWYDARHKAPVRRVADAYGSVDGRNRAGSKAKPKPRKPSPAERRRRKRGRAR